MGEMINWAEMPERDKNKLLHIRVMGHSPDEPCTGHFVPKNPEPDGLYCTGCNADICWSDEEYHEEPNPPRYTKDMNATMQIITHLGEKQGMFVEFGYSPASQQYQPGTPHYYCQIMTQWWPEIKRVQAYGKTAQDAICVAALRTKDFQVINAFEALSVWRLMLETGEEEMYRTFEEAEKAYADRVKMLKQRLRWAVDVRKLKIEEVKVPEDYFNGIEMA